MKDRRAPEVLDGVRALEDVAVAAGYKSVVQVVARYTLFLDPLTVAQTGGQALFPVVRDMRRRGQIDEVDGRRVMYDDNTTPTSGWLWAANRRPGRDVQYNHIWPRSKDADGYTALWNLCATPSFLAKTTDGRNHPEVVTALRYRSYTLYGCLPSGESSPTRPDGYDGLRWAPHAEPLADLEGRLRAALARAPKCRAAVAAREIGWVFSNGPDPIAGRSMEVVREEVLLATADGRSTTDPAEAASAEIIEYDKAGNVVRRTYGSVQGNSLPADETRPPR